jgi:hypothetical protein
VASLGGSATEAAPRRESACGAGRTATGVRSCESVAATRTTSDATPSFRGIGEYRFVVFEDPVVRIDKLGVNDVVAPCRVVWVIGPMAARCLGRHSDPWWCAPPSTALTKNSSLPSPGSCKGRSAQCTNRGPAARAARFALLLSHGTPRSCPCRRRCPLTLLSAAAGNDNAGCRRPGVPGGTAYGTSTTKETTAWHLRRPRVGAPHGPGGPGKRARVRCRLHHGELPPASGNGGLVVPDAAAKGPMNGRCPHVER